MEGYCMKNYTYLVSIFILITSQVVDQLKAKTNNSEQFELIKKEEIVLNNLKTATQKSIPTVIEVLKNEIIPLAESYSEKFHKELANMVSKEQSKQTATQGKTTAALQELENFVRIISTLLEELLNNQQTEITIFYNKLKQIEQDAARALQIAFAKAQGW
jgi:uncharacterized protein YceH (UPF0502 family)